MQSRSRTCSEPKPRFSGHFCRGSAKEKQTCKLAMMGGEGETCPGGVDSSSLGTWSTWSEWSECVTDCTSESRDEENKGKRSRSRNCNVFRDGQEVLAQSFRDCPGHAEEVEKCFVSPEHIDCAGNAYFTKKLSSFARLSHQDSTLFNTSLNYFDIFFPNKIILTNIIVIYCSVVLTNEKQICI